MRIMFGWPGIALAPTCLFELRVNPMLQEAPMARRPPRPVEAEHAPMEPALEARLRDLKEAQRLLARTRRKLVMQEQRDDQVLKDAFVLYVLEDCELTESLLYTKTYTNMSVAAVQEELERRFLQTPLEELSKVACVDGTITPAVSRRCARFHAEYQIAARVRRLNADVGIAPGWVSLSNAIKDKKHGFDTCIPRASSEHERQKKRWKRWRVRWAARVSKVVTHLGGNMTKVSAKVTHFCSHETSYWVHWQAQNRARKAGPETVFLRLRERQTKPQKRTPKTFPADYRLRVLRSLLRGPCGTAQQTRRGTAAMRSFA